MGGRPLERTISKHVMLPLARAILSKALEPGDSVALSVRQDRLAFDFKKAVLPPVTGVETAEITTPEISSAQGPVVPPAP